MKMKWPKLGKSKKVVDVTPDEKRRITYLLAIYIGVCLLAFLFTLSTLSYYATEFTDWLIGSGFLLIAVSFGIGYLIATRIHKNRYFDTNKILIIPLRNGVVVEEYSEELHDARGETLVLERNGKTYEVPCTLWQKIGKTARLFSSECAIPKPKKGAKGVWILQSRHREFDLLEAAREQATHAEDMKDRYKEIATDALNDVRDVYRTFGEREKFARREMKPKEDPYEIDRGKKSE